MKLYFFKNIFDNVVTKEASLDLSWDEACELFSHHTIVDTKEGIDLFIAANFRFDGIVQRQEGCNGPQRVAANVESVNAIVLDYDGGTSMVEAVSRVDGLRHLGYTSHSHLKDGVTEKFRILIPFETPCPIEEWNCRKQDVLSLFPGTDPSTVTISRAFYLPSCPPSHDLQKFAWNCDGEIFDWRILERREPYVPPPPIDVTNLVDDGVGPVVWETFDMVQFFKDQGLYIGPAGANKHNVICPNRQHNDGGTVIWQDGVSAPKFYCSHSKCSGFNLGKHFASKYGGYQWKSKYCKREKPRDILQMADAIKALKNKNRGNHNV